MRIKLEDQKIYQFKHEYTNKFDVKQTELVIGKYIGLIVGQVGDKLEFTLHFIVEGCYIEYMPESIVDIQPNFIE